MATRRKLYTADDLLRLPEDDCRYELLDGVLVKMSPPGNPHGGVQITVGSILREFARAYNAGRVFGDIGVFLRHHPDRVRAPDVCFVSRKRIPAGGLPGGFLDLIPDLIVEIISPSERRGQIEEKVQDWLQAGARIIWLVHTEPRTVTVYETGRAPRVLTAAETLTAEPVLSGFSVPVAALFE